MEIQNKSSIHMIAAGLYAAVAVISLIGLFSGFNFLSFLMVLACGAIAALLFMERRDVILPTVFGVVALIRLIALLIRFNFTNLLGLDSAVLAALIMFAFLTDFLPNLRSTAKSLWFLPAALLALRVLITVIQVLPYRHYIGFIALFFSFFVFPLCEAAALAFACLWVVQQNPEEIPARTTFQNGGSTMNSGATYRSTGANNYSAPVNRTVGPESEGYYSLVMHVILLLFTFGIWEYIWIYRMTGYLNRVEGEEYRDPTKKLLLCIFVPFYYIYWIYKSAQRIDKYAQMNGVQSDISTLCLVMCFVVSILPPILMQDKVNAIVTAKGAQTPADPFDPQPNRAPAPNAESPRDEVSSIADELAKLQEMLNRGIITQEEYDAMRKQILGL